jgi:hypothetical protein
MDQLYADAVGAKGLRGLRMAIIRLNSGRLAAFHQLDVRFDKTFLFQRWILKAYLDITNIYNNPNVELNQANYDFTRRAALTGLPIIPSFGIRAEF